MTAKNIVVDFLNRRGIKPRENEFGLTFNCEGWDFLLWYDEDDPSFYRLTLPGVFDVTDENYAESIMAANSINWTFKVVKAIVYEYEDKEDSGASVWMCFEHMLDVTSNADEMVSRSISIMIEAAKTFLKEVNENMDAD